MLAGALVGRFIFHAWPSKTLMVKSEQRKYVLRAVASSAGTSQDGRSPGWWYYLSRVSERECGKWQKKLNSRAWSTARSLPLTRRAVWASPGVIPAGARTGETLRLLI